MKNEIIDDAIYTASPEDITKYRYNPLLGVLLTALAGFLLWANVNWEWFEMHEVASQWNLLAASCLLCTGLTMVCYRFFGDSSAPMDRKTRERLYRSEYGFEIADLSKVQAAFDKGDFMSLRKMPTSYHPTLQVICYRTDSGSLLATQMIARDHAVNDIRIFRQGEYTYEDAAELQTDTARA